MKYFISRTHDSVSKVIAASYTLTNALVALPTTIELKKYTIAKLQSQNFGVGIIFNNPGKITKDTQVSTLTIEISDDAAPTPLVIQKMEIKPFIEQGASVFLPLIGVDKERTLTVKLQLTSTITPLAAADYPQVRVTIEDR